MMVGEQRRPVGTFHEFGYFQTCFHAFLVTVEKNDKLCWYFKHHVSLLGEATDECVAGSLLQVFYSKAPLQCLQGGKDESMNKV